MKFFGKKEVFEGAIFEIRNGITKQIIGEYKVNEGDYVLEGDGYKIINRDIRDVRPYVRYLATNKKEKLRHNLILYMAVGVGFLIFLVFNMKGDLSSIKDMIESGTGNIKEESLISDTIINDTLKEYIPGNEVLENTGYIVNDVVDGDTIKYMKDGEVVSVRLIGVDTPEVGEYYYTEASRYLEELILGKSVDIVLDGSQGEFDYYDRQLAYIFLDGQNINERIIRNGYGEEYTYDKDYKYKTDFVNAQNIAKQNNLGIWFEYIDDGKGKGI